MLNLGVPVIIGGNINIDRNPANDPLSRPNLKELYPLLDDFIISNNLTQMNCKPTRHRHGQKLSLLDLFITNCSNKVNGVQYVLNSLLPSTMANSIISDISNIINLLSLETRVQLKKSEHSSLSKETREMKRLLNLQITKAISSKEPEEHRLRKNMRNRLQKKIHQEKKTLIQAEFRKNKWKAIKKYENKENDIPTRLLIDQKILSSPKIIASELATFFSDKVRVIREGIKSGHRDKLYIDILSNTLPKFSNSCDSDVTSDKKRFSFEQVTIQEVYKVITNAKSRNSKGHDRLSMRSMKEMPHVMSIFITHLFNSIVTTKQFPEILKLTKLLPTKKPGKDSLNKECYRPITILPTVEKVIEEILKNQLTEFIESNNIIPPEHHGGRSNHSTVTANTIIDYNSGKTTEEHKTPCIVTTDLSAAYDTVDHAMPWINSSIMA